MVLALLLLVFASLLSLALAGMSFAPFLPSLRRDARLALAAADLSPGERFVDLGCGTGKVVFLATRTFGARGHGVEMAPPLFALCLIRKWFGRYRSASFRLGSLYDEDLRDTDVVYVFGRRRMSRLGRKIQRELAPGARVVSHTFPIEGLDPERTVALRGNRKAYLYRF